MVPNHRQVAACIAITFAFGTWLPADAAENAVILKQTSPPLNISEYKARYSSGYSTNPEQISHSVTYTNISGKDVVAVQIGLASFDAFNGFMDRFSGWSMQPLAVGVTKTGEWTHRPYAAFSFQGYGTGVAYVNAVRFSDGSIWRANLTEVLFELQKFEKDLKKEDLLEKKKP